MGIVGRLDQYASMLAGEFDDYSMSENLLTYSEQFNDASWSKTNSSISQNSIAAPDGFSTADKLVENNTNNQHIVYKSRTGSNETVTFSVFAKAAERSKVWMQLSNFSTVAVNVAFTLTGSGTVSNLSGNNADYTNNSASIVSYPNGWYRCILTTTKGSVNTTNNPTISVGDSSSNLSYLGDGVSGIYIWGAQLEVGSVATDYTPTTTTAKTRVLSSTTNTNITGLSTYFSSGFSENVGAATTLAANVFPPYDLVYDDFGGTLFGAGQGRYMRQNTDKSVIVYNEIDEVSDFYSRGVVRAGLVLDLDAGIDSSYPGTGTTWTDLSPYGNNGELVNSPTYNSSNSGYFQFVTDDFARMQNNTALDTQTPSVEVWVKTNATTQNGFWFEKGEVNTQYSLFQEGSSIQWRMNIGGITNLSTTTATYMNTTSWYQIVGTYTSGSRKLYINGTLVNSDGQTGTIATNSGGMSIGVYGGYAGGRGYYYNGNLAICRVYNRVLTAAEIKQNYDATKGRFGL